MNRNIQLVQLHTVVAISSDGTCLERYPNVAEMTTIGDRILLVLIGDGVTEVTIEKSRLQAVEPSEYIFIEREP